MSIVKISALPALTTASGVTVVAAVDNNVTKKLSLDGIFNYVLSDLVQNAVTATSFHTTGTISANTLTFTGGSISTFGDIPVTNRFYVDPARTDTATYTANGSEARPFATVMAAVTAANASPLSPTYVILLGSTSENVSLTKGHVFLTGEDGGIHSPIYLTGQVTITPAGADLGTNHFSISHLGINGPSQGAAIRLTGSQPARLFLNDLWLTASGNQTGTTHFVDAGGYGFYQDNTGTGTITSGSEIKVSHGGVGDVYCFDIIHGTATFSEVETSGATQVAAVQDGATLSFSLSELDASGETCVEAYGSGVLAVLNSVIGNASTGTAYGIWLRTPGLPGAGSSALISGCTFNVLNTSTSSFAVKGLTGTYLLHANNSFAYNPATGLPTNRQISTAMGAGIIALPTTFVPA